MRHVEHDSAELPFGHGGCRQPRDETLGGAGTCPKSDHALPIGYLERHPIEQWASGLLHGEDSAKRQSNAEHLYAVMNRMRKIMKVIRAERPNARDSAAAVDDPFN